MIEQTGTLSQQSDDQQMESNLARSLKNVLANLQELHESLPDTTLYNSLPPNIKRRSLKVEPKSTSTPISVPPPLWALQHGWSSSSSSDGSPILKRFNDSGPSPYSRPSQGVPIMVDVSTESRDGGRPNPSQILQTHAQSVGMQVTGVSVGIQAAPLVSNSEMLANEGQTPPTSEPEIYRAPLSPSDEWIYHTSTKETSPSSFAPTSVSPYPDDFDFSDQTPPAQGPVSKGVENIVQYPSSIEGLSITPSLQRMLYNQSDFSLTSEVDRGQWTIHAQ